MPVYKMTSDQTREWLGVGLMMPAIKPQPPAQPVDADQDVHDKSMGSLTPARRAAMVKGLGALARSKLGGG
jgi:hypothetical protein